MTATVRSLLVPLALFGLTLLGCAEADAPSPPAAETPVRGPTPAPFRPEVVDPGNRAALPRQPQPEGAGRAA
jgi:hypothetical protein